MRVPLGRLIWVDSGDFLGGQCLWMVTRGPYICELCGKEFDAVAMRRNSLRDSMMRRPMFKILSAEETLKRKRLLVWTGSDEYSSDLAMPDWVLIKTFELSKTD